MFPHFMYRTRCISLGVVGKDSTLCYDLSSPWINPFREEVSHVKHIEWVSKRLEDTFMYWRSQFWPFHVRLKVIQSIMIYVVSYYLPLLPWSKRALEMVSHSM